MESALGMSYAGKRAMVCMKHVGLNVAADPFINAAMTGINGGLIVTVADDPSMHSSQNEQDSRFYGKFAMIPILEPSNQQEAYDMTRTGFELIGKIGDSGSYADYNPSGSFACRGNSCRKCEG
jgi:indolepyruvate ferredoxin oxidoreductase alpha subunit